MYIAVQTMRMRLPHVAWLGILLCAIRSRLRSIIILQFLFSYFPDSYQLSSFTENLQPTAARRLIDSIANEKLLFIVLVY